MSPWGPNNPHPLSQMKTELIWEGKYDEYGNRRPVRLPESPLPLQCIERIDEPRDRIKAQQPSLFDEQKFHQQAHPDDWHNMLIWGDNKLVMAALLEQFRGKIDLIYIDPPFDVGADFTMEVQLGDGSDAVKKEQSILEAVAYRDTWGKGTDSYLHMMYERLTLMRELLSERGSIYVHCDWRVNFLIRSVMKEVFGKENFRNEIIWHYPGQSSAKNFFPRKHDTIFWFSKTSNWIFNSDQVRVPYKESSIKRGQYGGGPGVGYRKEGLKPGWLPEEGKIADSVWEIVDIRLKEFTTQKPNALLERIIKASTNEGDLVADFFCGSGTTLVVAERLGRRWIGVDLGRYAIHVSRKQLIEVQRELYKQGKPYRPFDVYNLGRYERQWWQQERLKGADEEHRRVMLRFYKATELTSPPHPLLHGKKGAAYVHVDQIDSLFTYEELCKVVQAVAGVGGREVHCLAWEFEMELGRKKERLEAETGVTIRLKYIPREIMEPNRTEVQFFEAGYLEVQPIIQSGKVDVKLVNFMPALAEVPKKELEALRERAIKSPFDFIDFWAVDFDYSSEMPFKHHWKDFRTRRDRSLKTCTDIGWKYDTPGKHQIGVKVIDVFGVDTTTVVEVEV